MRKYTRTKTMKLLTKEEAENKYLINQNWMKINKKIYLTKKVLQNAYYYIPIILPNGDIITMRVKGKKSYDEAMLSFNKACEEFFKNQNEKVSKSDDYETT